MKQVYVFTRNQNEYFPDAVSVGELFLAPILDSNVIDVIEYFKTNDFSCEELTANQIINDVQTQAMITDYENAKIVSSYYQQEEI